MSMTAWRHLGVLFATGLLVQCAEAPNAARSNRAADAAVEEQAVKQMLIDWYAAYSGDDEANYRAFVTEDYELLENGTVMGVEDDLKAMRNRPSGYRRRDTFDFQSVRMHGELAYATYFLDSEIVDDKRIRQFRWLESAILRKIEGRWRAALLHSTRVSLTETPR